MEEPTKKEKNTGMAIVAYILFFIPLLTDAKNDPFVKYHVKQGLSLFLVAVVIRIIAYIPTIGWALVWPFNLLLVILFVLGVMHALNGEQKPLPVIGKFGEKFKF